MEAPPRTTFTSRQIAEKAEMFARCAVPRNLERVREVVDGVPNSSSFRFAIGWLATTNPACLSDRSTFASSSLSLGKVRTRDGIIIDEGLYRRGAVLDVVFQNYVEEIRLTRAMTADSEVQARFNAREVGRNRLRLPADYRYFEVAVCMVREAPELAARLIRADRGSAEEQRIVPRFVDDASICIGETRKLVVNPVEFRIYVADALYRWLVAARHVETLLPARGG